MFSQQIKDARGEMKKRGWRLRPSRVNKFMQQKKRIVEMVAPLNKDDWIVIAGAGGFSAGNLALCFRKKGFTRIRSVDKKPLYGPRGGRAVDPTLRTPPGGWRLGTGLAAAQGGVGAGGVL